MMNNNNSRELNGSHSWLLLKTIQTFDGGKFKYYFSIILENSLNFIS